MIWRKKLLTLASVPSAAGPAGLVDGALGGAVGLMARF
jgi:hypothetical protein